MQCMVPISRRIEVPSTCCIIRLFLTFVLLPLSLEPKLVGAGITCSFVSVEANEGEILKILDSSEQRASMSTTIGLFCEGDFYDLEGDLMWDLSRIFLNVALAFASLAVVIAWSISTFVLPTKNSWKLISITSALSAVLQVPIFLVFETEPCKDFPQQQCELSDGCYLLMGSVICSVFVTILTVCLDPPDWVSDPDTWRIPKGRTADLSVLSGDEDAFLHSPTSPSESSSYVGQQHHWPLWKTRPKTPLAANPNPGSVPGDVESAPTIRDFGWKASETDEFMVLPARADLESATARSISSSAKYGARPDEESRIGALSQITGDESVLDANESYEHEEPETAATENMFAAAATVATVHSAARTSVGEASDVGLNTVASLKLQHELSRPIETEAPSKILSDDKVPPKANPILGFASRVLPERRRRNRVVKGYAFMDDDDMESSLPMSPPLEVIVNFGQHNEEHDLAAIHSAHGDDQDLLDDWNALHNYVPAPVGDKASRSPDPLALSSDDDSDISDPEDEEVYSNSVTDPVDSNNPAMHVTNPRGSPRSSPSKSKRRRRLRSTNSVTSAGTSLLDLTIEEETAVDLQEFESDTEEKYEPVKLVRQRSAPNLAAFHSGFANREKVCEEVHMEGLNSYHRVETWRSTGPMRPSAERPKPLGSASQRMGRSRSLTPLKGMRRLVSRSPSPAASMQTPKKSPLWKEEREFRGGIHNQVSFSSDTDSGDENQSHATSPSLVSRARYARMKRLQRASTTKSLDTTPTRRTTRTLDVPINPACISPDDTSSTLLDTIDLQLAEVQRPDGAEYGPDERSL
jgi:hypothetical protein